MSTRPESTEHAFQLLTRFAREHETLKDEWIGSLQDFFGATIPTGDAASTLKHARRHLEWFLLERHSPSLFGVPAERLLSDWKAATAEAGLDEGCMLGHLESFCGAFQVTGLAEDGAWLRDLAGLGDYPLSAPESDLEVGDLLVGRLYPGGEGLHHASPGTSTFRDEDLVRAVQRDLDHARSKGSKVLHLSQLELERLFFPAHQADAGSQPDPVEQAKATLLEEGIPAGQIKDILKQLSADPYDSNRLTPGAGDLLSTILDQFAFETDVDLDRTRSALACAWSHLAIQRTKATGNAPASAHPEAHSALVNFDEGRAAGRDLDDLFGELEKGLGLEVETEDTGEPTPAPDFPGVVAAMLEEFTWEVEQREGPESAIQHGALAPLGEFAAKLGRFEELDSTELLRFTTFWLPERAELAGDQARQLLSSLSAFCAWAEEAHQIPLATEFSPTLTRLAESLPRILELNRALPEPPADATGSLFAVLADSSGRFSGLVDRDGNNHRAVLEEPLASRLRPGDRLRGNLDPEGRLSLYRCYPPEAGGLLAS